MAGFKAPWVSDTLGELVHCSTGQISPSQDAKQATLLLGWPILCCGGDDVVIIGDSPARFPNLRLNEHLGDPCPCGCGGTKVLPTKLTAKVLAVETPCETCGEKRFYGKKGLHKRKCLSCSQIGIIRFAQDEKVVAFPAFRALLRSILQSRGITMRKALHLAKLDNKTVTTWINGQGTPWRESVEKLAAVLEAPELVDAIPSRALTVTTTCPKCGESRLWTAGVLRDEIRKTPKVPATIDWDKGTGTRPCVKCTRGKNMKILRQTLMHNRGGKKFYNKFLRSFTPEEHASAIANSVETNTGRQRNQEERLKIAGGHVRPVLSGALVPCRLCPYLVYTYPNRLPHIHEVHQPCLQQYCRENQTAFDDRCYPPRITDGKTVHSPDDCKRLYEVAVRVLLRVPRDENEAVGGIAKDYGVASRTVRLWVNELLDLLPPDQRGGKWLTKKAEVLRWAADTNQARQEIAPARPEKKIGPMEIAQAYLLTAVPSTTDLVPSLWLFEDAKDHKITKKTLRGALEKGRYKTVQISRAWHWRRKRLREA